MRCGSYFGPMAKGKTTHHSRHQWTKAKGEIPVRASEDTAIKAHLIIGAAVRMSACSGQELADGTPCVNDAAASWEL